LVVEDGKTTPDEVQRSLSILEETNFAGMVLNKSKGTVTNSYQYPVE